MSSREARSTTPSKARARASPGERGFNAIISPSISQGHRPSSHLQASEPKAKIQISLAMR
jgi:hypothetical protein